jgi:hypothetical protein
MTTGNDTNEIARRIAEQRPTTARHEAGHAIAAIHYECPIENVSIGGQWPILGTTRIGVSRACDIIVIICGPLAEHPWNEFYPGARVPLRDLLGQDAESFSYLRQGLNIADDELLDLKAEAVVFLSDADVQAQIDRIAQALLDTDAAITSDQVRAISQFTVTRAPSGRPPRQ